MERTLMAEEYNPLDGNIANSISMLEQILEVMPQDVDAIRALYRAYCVSENREQAFEHLTRLVELAQSEGDPELLEFVRNELPHFEDVYPEKTAAHLARMRTIALPAQELPAASAAGGEKAGGNAEADISEELALAWRMYEESQLSQEEYSSVLHDLTEVSSKELDVPVSVLHVLNDRGFTQMNRIMNYLSTRSGVPCISLINFELDEEAATLLPVERSIHDGALPFAFMGDDLLVAVLNPFNNALVDKVETDSGRRCHTYLVLPEEYDACLGKLRSLKAAA
jgi:tetratricopeptide (TPR) repeat protein